MRTDDWILNRYAVQRTGMIVLEGCTETSVTGSLTWAWVFRHFQLTVFKDIISPITVSLDDVLGGIDSALAVKGVRALVTYGRAKQVCWTQTAEEKSIFMGFMHKKWPPYKLSVLVWRQDLQWNASWISVSWQRWRMIYLGPFRSYAFQQAVTQWSRCFTFLMNFLLIKFTNVMNLCHLADYNLHRRRENRVLLLEKTYPYILRNRQVTLEAAVKGKGRSRLCSISPVTQLAAFAMPSSSFFTDYSILFLNFLFLYRSN